MTPKNICSFLFALFTLLSVISQNPNHEYIENELLVKFRNTSDIPLILRPESHLTGVQQNDTKHTNWFDHLSSFQLKEIQSVFRQLDHPELNKVFCFSFDEGLEWEKVQSYLSKFPEIELVERIPVYRTFLEPDDPEINSQWHLNTIQAGEAWDIHTGSEVVIAIVDDAVRISHEDLAPNIWINPGEIPGDGIDNDNNGFIDDVNGWDFADNDNDPNPPSSATAGIFTHGTHCAGIASAATNNGKGIASIGYGTKIMALKATRDQTEDARVLEDVFSGVQYAVNNGAEVISMSWGSPTYSQIFQDFINAAHELGIIMVAAAGNDNSEEIFYPAGYDNVISVAASGQNDQKASFSNFGTWIDIIAPGEQIYSTVAADDNTYGLLSGTSMACPLVAGLCALGKSYVPTSDPDFIESCLASTADNIDAQNASFMNKLGAGRINALNFLGCLNPSTPPSARFISTSASGCEDLAVAFLDNSAGTVTSWSWSFPGGSPSSSTANNPTITYSTPGIYNVTLIVSNEFGSDTITRTNYIQIFDKGLSLPFEENFESGEITSKGWVIDNPDRSVTWRLYEVGGTDPGNTAAGIEFFNYNDFGQRDGLQTPPLDFSGFNQVNLSFEHAYRRFNSNSSDSLLIYISTDCGNTFSQKVLSTGEDGTGSFATASLSTVAFLPLTDGEWCDGDVGADCFSIDLTEFAGNPNVVIRFESVAQFQNNLFLDNIRVIGSEESPAPEASFEAAPNGGCGPLTVSLSNQSLRASTFEWLFPGGNPSSSNEANPNVQYSDPGTYTITLYASDEEGNIDTLVRESIVEVLDCGNAICDTLSNFSTPNATLYSFLNGGGFLSGHNNFLDRAKVDFFANIENFKSINGALMSFAVAVPKSENSTVEVSLWDAKGINGVPLNKLASVEVNIAEIAEDIQNDLATEVNFGSQINIDGPFYMGIELAYGPNGLIEDTVALLTSVDGEIAIGTAWEQNEEGNWSSFQATYDGLRVAHAIFPFVSQVSVTAITGVEDNEVCLGESIQIINQSENADQFEWMIEGDTILTSSDFEPDLSNLPVGSYTISLKASGACGNSIVSANTQNVSIRPGVDFSLETIKDETCGQKNGIIVARNLSSDALNYEWSSNANFSGDTLASVSFGVYEVIGTNSFGCQAKDTAIVKEISGPTVSVAEWTDATCGLANGSALASVNGGTLPYTFSWDDESLTDDSLALSLDAGTYIITVLDANNCEAEASVTLAGSPKISIRTSIQNASCGNEDGRIELFPESGIAPFTYLWNIEGMVDTSQQVNLAPGTYEIFVEDANRCSDTIFATVLEVATELPDSGLPTQIEECDSVWLTHSAVDIPFEWFDGSKRDSLLIKESGKYWISYFNDQNCSKTDSVQVEIISTPKAHFELSFEENTVITTNLSENAVEYTWYFGDGNKEVSAAPIYQYDTTGNFELMLVAESKCGVDTATQQLIISQQGIVTSVNEAWEPRLALFPNPNQGDFTLSLQMETPLDASLAIVDQLGNEILKQPLRLPAGNWQKNYSFSHLANGIYYITILNGNQLWSSRWVKTD